MADETSNNSTKAAKKAGIEQAAAKPVLRVHLVAAESLESVESLSMSLPHSPRAVDVATELRELP